MGPYMKNNPQESKYSKPKGPPGSGSDQRMSPLISNYISRYISRNSLLGCHIAERKNPFSRSFIQQKNSYVKTFSEIWVHPDNVVLSYRKSDYPGHFWDCENIREYLDRALYDLDLADIVNKTTKIVATDSHVTRE